MTMHLLRRSALVRALASLLLGGIGMAAPGVPPAIEDIVGTYSVSYRETIFNVGTGVVGKWSYAVTWEIRSAAPSQVEIEISFPPETFRAFYREGLLVWGNGDTANNPARRASVGYAWVSGVPGRMKLKGAGAYDSLGTWNLCETDVFSGRMIPGPPTEVREEASRAGGERATELPTIDDLVGYYDASFRGSQIRVGDGTTIKRRSRFEMRIEKIDERTLQIHVGGSPLRGHYRNGILVLATVDDPVLASEALLQVLRVKGKPGKISIQGFSIATRDIGTLDGTVDTATFSARYLYRDA
ncbi:MAG: hypothetical protein IPN34_15090 [Planctomycetes bacterium]|nr:hypothetical protein [Planctomycetota bacterium]